MIQSILSFVFLFSTALAFANTNAIKPSSVVIDQNSADIIEGVYSDKENENWAYDLIDLKVVGQYDEAVISYENIQPGKYQYRFAKISKKLTPFSDCEFESTEGHLNDVKNEVKKQTSRSVLLSKKGAETAEIRLTSVLPDDESGGPVILSDECGGDARPDQRLAWKLAAKPNADWISLEVKTAKNLVIRVPKKIYDASVFELVLVK